MVKRLAAIAAFLLALIVFAPAAIGHAQTEDGDSGTAEAADDLYAGCRDVGDSISIPGLSQIAEWGCDGLKAVTNPGAAAGEFAGGLGSSAVGKAAEVFLEGWKKGITFMLSWWMTNSVTGPASGDTEGTVWQVHKFLRIFEIAAFFVSVGISALKLAWRETGSNNSTPRKRRWSCRERCSRPGCSCLSCSPATSCPAPRASGCSTRWSGKTSTARWRS
ncbi:hypothetical protein GS943_03995 [Rhodococcus hoagii]|nr:hypothetical protein [Prescottella equi]